LLAPSHPEGPRPELCRFKHAITREITYESLAHASRGALHEQCARQLEAAAGGDDQLDLLAYHYARSPNDPKAIVYLARNAARAAGLFANAAAVDQYRAALDRAMTTTGASPLPLTVLARSLGDVYAQMADFDQALTAYAEARTDHAAGTIVTAEIDLCRADVLLRATRFDEAMEVIVQTEATVERAEWGRHGRILLAQLATLRSIKAFRQGNHHQALHAAEHGLRTLDPIPNEIPQVATTRIRLYQSLVAVTAVLKDHHRARQALNRALRLIRRYPHPVVEGELQLRKALLAMANDTPIAAVRLFRQTLPLIEATGTRDRLAYLLIPGGHTLAMRGEVVQGQDWIERGTRLGEEIGSTFLISSGWYLLGWLQCKTGAWDAALNALMAGKHLAQQHELHDRLMGLLIFEGQIDMYRGEYQRSTAVFLHALDLAQRHAAPSIVTAAQQHLAYSAHMQGQGSPSITDWEASHGSADPVRSSDDALHILSHAEWWAMLAAASMANPRGDDAVQVATGAWNCLRFLRQQGIRLQLPFAERVNAMVAYEMGNLAAAARRAHNGARIGRQIGLLPETARCLFWQGKTMLRQHPGAVRALNYLQEAAALFRQLGAVPELDQVNAVLASARSALTFLTPGCP
jgi:tetratricopeptide (TPR) repeat protein